MNITIKRNTAQTLTWTKTGDYSGDTIEFTVKADRSLTSARAIDKTASVSVSSGVSTFTVSLVPSDSASLSADLYYYDLRVETSSTDRESLFDGLAYLDKSVRNDTDGSSVSTASTVTTLTGADFDTNDTLVSDGTDVVGKSVSEMKTLLGLPTYTYIAKVYQPTFLTIDPIFTEIFNNFGYEIIAGCTRQSVGYSILSFHADFINSYVVDRLLDLNIQQIGNGQTHKIVWEYAGNLVNIKNYSTADFTTLLEGINIIIKIQVWS